ncbi:8681_t:CDS:2 [Funneliformis mosseae]|uniref:8681_t:CDS:1 n=1 Tax=Funneliformis mosseae TaxID=27381 RepID=A0A9N9GMV1_FUNMO|nr:8681_t:CDS:2 [Funneliformis mosseae]
MKLAKFQEMNFATSFYRVLRYLRANLYGPNHPMEKLEAEQFTQLQWFNGKVKMLLRITTTHITFDLLFNELELAILWNQTLPTPPSLLQPFPHPSPLTSPATTTSPPQISPYLIQKA